MAATDLNTVRQTIEARLATELASSPAIPVVFNNMPFDASAQDSFVQCSTSFGSGSYLFVIRGLFLKNETECVSVCSNV